MCLLTVTSHILAGFDSVESACHIWLISLIERGTDAEKSCWQFELGNNTSDVQRQDVIARMRPLKNTFL